MLNWLRGEADSMAWNMATADGALFGNVMGLWLVVILPGTSTFHNLISRTSEVLKLKEKTEKEKKL